MRSWFADHRWKVIGWSLVGAILFNVAVVGGFVWRSAQEFDPLGPFPVQAVDLPLVANGGDGGQYPGLVVKNDQWPDVPVNGEKCSAETVNVEGSSQWVSVIPPGTFSGPQLGRTQRLAGCTRFAFRNRVPDEVRDRVRELAKWGTTTSVWSIQGKETPFRPDTNEPGSPEFWSTRNFAIVWEN